MLQHEPGAARHCYHLRRQLRLHIRRHDASKLVQPLGRQTEQVNFLSDLLCLCAFPFFRTLKETPDIILINLFKYEAQTALLKDQFRTSQ